MNEHQRETAFLRHCISYDESPGRQELDERLTQIQRDERSVRCAVWLMAVLSALAVAGLGYAAVLIENFPSDASQPIVKILSALGLAAMICLMVFMGLRTIYRMKLNRRREECRRLVTVLLESRLGNPATTPWRDSRVNGENREIIPVAVRGNGTPAKTESTAGASQRPDRRSAGREG